MTPPDLLLGTLGALVGVGGLTGVLLLPRNRRKIDAEAAQILTGAAVALVQPLRSEVEALKGRVAILEAREHAQQILLLHHATWDAQVLAALRGAGVTGLPDPPPLHLESP